MKFPYVQMEVVERQNYEGISYFLIQTKSERDGFEVADVYPCIPNQRKVADLLAAAPDLLEALEHMIAWANCKPGTYPGGYPGTRAAAAIARAKGEA